jgi:hypothetical protein
MVVQVTASTFRPVAQVLRKLEKMIITDLCVTPISVPIIGQDITSVALAEIGATGETPLLPQPDSPHQPPRFIPHITTTTFLDRSLWGSYSGSGR